MIPASSRLNGCCTSQAARGPMHTTRPLLSANSRQMSDGSATYSGRPVLTRLGWQVYRPLNSPCRPISDIRCPEPVAPKADGRTDAPRPEGGPAATRRTRPWSVGQPSSLVSRRAATRSHLDAACTLCSENWPSSACRGRAGSAPATSGKADHPRRLDLADYVSSRLFRKADGHTADISRERQLCGNMLNACSRLQPNVCPRSGSGIRASATQPEAAVPATDSARHQQPTSQKNCAAVVASQRANETHNG